MRLDLQTGPSVEPVYAILHPFHEPDMSSRDLRCVHLVPEESLRCSELTRGGVLDHESEREECYDYCRCDQDYKCERKE